MSYHWLRSLLFQLPPERAHYLTLTTLEKLARLPGTSSLLQTHDLPRHTTSYHFGLPFKNRLGVAAGLDKDARYVDALAKLGFGAVEVGTVTPYAQPGNPKPRLFRLREDKALINRLGFNNDGAEATAARLQKRKSKVIIGGNIGKNKSTPNEKAIEDYEFCFRTLHPQVDYFVVNVSSPNTPGLRELQEKKALKKLLSRLQKLNNKMESQRPLLLKIAPDLTHPQLDDILEIAHKTELDGLIATNTTIARDGLATDKKTLDRIGNGGLSGRPLTDQSTSVIRYLTKHKKSYLTIIGVGGIMTSQDAMEKIDAGASLLQLYTGLIYEGPPLVANILNAIALRENAGSAPEKK